MLTKEQVQHIATLARLKLSDDEVEQYQTQLSSILDFVAQLQTIATEDIEPLHQVGEQISVLRDDEMFACEDRELLLDSAPERSNDFVKTPAVFED